MTISKADGIKLNDMSTLARLNELLNHPKKYKSILRNNVNILFPVAEEQATFWDNISKDIKRAYPTMNAKDSGLDTCELEALEWNKVARRCCLEVLNINPDRVMRVKWGISCLVGHQYSRDQSGRITNVTGGRWVEPKHGYYSKDEAIAVMNQMHKADMDRFAIAQLPPPCKIVPIEHKSRIG